ncbi:MAG: hypothetical protein D3917_06295 [Candidatus Electrothrix sp. AX5]|nr:hypothetical protein [Candidatus Electrothrix sp. AX5]
MPVRDHAVLPSYIFLQDENSVRFNGASERRAAEIEAVKKGKGGWCAAQACRLWVSGANPNFCYLLFLCCGVFGGRGGNRLQPDKR